jgi:hypothetical protein
MVTGVQTCALPISAQAIIADVYTLTGVRWIAHGIILLLVSEEGRTNGSTFLHFTVANFMPT